MVVRRGMRFRPTLGALLLLVGCAGAAPRPATTAPVPAAEGRQAPKTAGAAVPAAGVRELPELVTAFEDARVTGTIALYDTQDGVLGCSDVKKCQEAVTPASTFKIAHSMIALETGVVDGPD